MEIGNYRQKSVSVKPVERVGQMCILPRSQGSWKTGREEKILAKMRNKMYGEPSASNMNAMNLLNF